MRQGLSLLAAKKPENLIEQYAQIRESTYQQAGKNGLCSIMDAAATSLRSRVDDEQRSGRILYIGSGSAAALGCIDASEMPDTYGAPVDSLRGDGVHPGCVCTIPKIAQVTLWMRFFPKHHDCTAFP